jgi:hypothetical protein
MAVDALCGLSRSLRELFDSQVVASFWADFVVKPCRLLFWQLKFVDRYSLFLGGLMYAASRCCF